MTRREMLVNILLVAVIAWLLSLVLTAPQGNVELEVPDLSESSKTTTETSYSAALAKEKFPALKQKDPFKEIMTPTPSPPPPTPTPTKTPDISKTLASWKLLSVDSGVATIEDRSKKEDNIFEMKVGETKPMEVEKGGGVRNLTLKRVDDKADNPSATFSLEGTTDEKTFKMYDEAAAAPPS